MSDLSATNCGGGCSCNEGNNSCCTWIIIILLLTSCCGGNGGFGGGSDWQLHYLDPAFALLLRWQ